MIHPFSINLIHIINRMNVHIPEDMVIGTTDTFRRASYDIY